MAARSAEPALPASVDPGSVARPSSRTGSSPRLSHDPRVRAAVAGAAALVAAFALSPDTIEDGPVVCPFRRMSGLPCPGCGLTRSWVYLAHGRWADAWSANPFGYLSMLVVAVVVALVAVALIRRTALPGLSRLTSRPVVLALGTLWIGFGVGRIVWMLGSGQF